MSLFFLVWFAWNAEGGTLSLTDDPARVPAAYEAVELEPKPLDCYERFTVVGDRAELAALCRPADEAPLELP